MRPLTDWPKRHLQAGAALLLAACSPLAAFANPQGGVVASGSAVIQQSGSQLQIHQSTNRAVIDWRGFDIAPHETTRFIQPGSGSWTLNRVNAANPSLIQGNLIANGNIAIINPNGVIFSGTSRVDAAGLVATTANITNANFMAGNMRFDQPGNPNAKIVNEGHITAKQAGLVGLVAPTVENSGIIEARLGKVSLAAGDRFTLDLTGDQLIQVSISDGTAARIKQSGKIHADGGRVEITAAAARSAVDSLIQVSGEVRTRAVMGRDGTIRIVALGRNAVKGNRTADKGKRSGQSRIEISGNLDASGLETGQKGGLIEVTADHVGLLTGASANASGYAGGGIIRIGGDYQGLGTTATASLTYIGQGVNLSADAIANGNGGKIIVWADGDTGFYGSISARGGATGGNGGFVEVSGKQWLDFQGTADTRAPQGRQGSLLLDPTDITISAAASTASMSWTGTQFRDITVTPSVLNVTTLQNQLALSNVTVTTASALLGNGDITVATPISWSSNFSLTLQANRDINVNQSISWSGNGNLTLSATRNITVAAGAPISWSGTGTMNMTSGQDILTNAQISGTSTGAANLQMWATRHITINQNIRSGQTGEIQLYGGNTQANQNNWSNVGRVNLNATASAGQAGIRIRSGHDGSSVRHNLSWNGTSLTYGPGAIAFLYGGQSLGTAGSVNNLELWGLGTVSFTSAARPGAIQLRFNGDATFGLINSSGAIDLQSTLNNVAHTVTATGAITSTGNAVTLTANRAGNLTINAGATITSGINSGVTLCAAGCEISYAGNLTLNAPVVTGRSLRISGGIYSSGNNNDVVWDGTNFTYGGQSVTFQYGDGKMSTAGNVTGLTLNGRNMTFSAPVISTGDISLIARNNLTVGNIETGTTSALTLWAGYTDAALLGVVTTNGTVQAGNRFSYYTGQDAMANRPDASWDGTSLYVGTQLVTFKNGSLASAGTIRSLYINGVRDINFTSDIYTTDLGVTLQSFRHLTAAAIVQTAGSLTISAANGNPNNVGYLNLTGGDYNVYAPDFALISGHDGSGNRPDLEIYSNYAQTGGTRFFFMRGAQNISNSTTFNSVNIQGFRDITAYSDIYNQNGTTMVASRNITVQGLRTSSTSSIDIRAANGSTAGVGVLTVNGPVQTSGYLRLISGQDGSNGRSDWLLDSSTFIPANGSTFGEIQVSGFRDITINRTINGTSHVNFTAMRNLSITGDISTTNNSADIGLNAAGGNVALLGELSLNGNVTYRRNLTLLTGRDVATNTTDQDLSTTLTCAQSPTCSGTATIRGFRHVNLLGADQSVSAINFSNITGDLTLNQSWATTGAMTISSNSLNTANNGILTSTGALSLTFGHSAAAGATSSTVKLNRASINTLSFTAGQVTLNVPNSFTVATAGHGGNTGSLIVNARGDIILAGDLTKTTGSLEFNADAELDSLYTLPLGYTANTGAYGSGSVYFSSGSQITTTSGNAALNSAALRADGVTAANANLTTLATGAGNYRFTTTSGYMALRGFGTITATSSAALAVSGAGTAELAPSNTLTFSTSVNNGNSAATLVLRPSQTSRALGVGDGAINTGLFLSTALLNNIGSGWGTVQFGHAAHAAAFEVAGRNWQQTIRFAAASGSPITFLGSIGSVASAATNMIFAGDTLFGSGINVDLTAASTSHGNITFGNFTHQLGGDLRSYQGGINLSGSTTLTGTGASTVSTRGTFNLASGAALHAASRDLTLQTDNITLDGTLDGTGNLNIQPLTAARIMGLGTSAPSTGLYLTDAEMGNIGTGFNTITFGTASSGDLTLTSQLSGYNNLAFRGRDLTFTQRIINALGIDARATRDVILNERLSATGGGTSILLSAARNFINNRGTDVLTATVGRWLVYSTSPLTDTRNGLTYDFKRYNCSISGSCPSFPATGNGLLYTYTPTVTLKATNITRSYGLANPDTGIVATGGLIDGDNLFDVVTGAPNYNTAANQYSGVGNHAIYLSAGTLSSPVGYTIAYDATPATLTITKASLTATVNNQSRAYGYSNPTLGWGDVVWTGFMNGENSSVITAGGVTIAATATATANAGTTHTIGIGGFNAANYQLDSVIDGTLTITKASLTATVNNQSRAYGYNNPNPTLADVTFTGFRNGQNYSVIDAGTVDVAAGATLTANAGTTHAITLNGFSDNNYDLTINNAGTLTITKANLTAAVHNQSRAYGDSNPTLTLADVTFTGFRNGEDESVIDTGTVDAAAGATLTANAGTTHAISLNGFNDNNYNLTVNNAGTLTITKKNITATVDNQSRAYGYSNPNLTLANVTFTGLANGEDASVIDAGTVNIAAGATLAARAGTTHAINLNGFSDNNYTLTVNNAGALTITKAAISLQVQ
ncbi:filamentous hemagglutinin N-terminal domain-containing protein, partial [bacterium]|nr:filamentous hemagglutinin N-terminal domain-containing protein [bacterium]